jgi:hypothetical protein
VTVAHEAIVEPPPEHAVEFFQLLFGPVPQECEVVVTDDAIKVIEILANEVFRLLDQPLAIAPVWSIGRRMALCNITTEFLHVGDRQQTGSQLCVETQGLVEATHPYGILERLAVAAEMRLAIASGYRHDIEVNFRSPGLVEPDLFVATEFAFLEAAEVQEVQRQRLLDLVGEVSGENDPRYMGLDEFDVVGGMVESRGFQQCLDEAVVDVGDCWRGSVHWVFPWLASLVVPLRPC